MNRWFKYICFTFIITVSLFFIGINNTKADGIGCQYRYSRSGNYSTGESHDDEYIVSVYYGKASGNSYYTSWGTCKFYAWNNQDEDCFDSESYDNVFNNADNFSSYFVNDDGSYKCPDNFYMHHTLTGEKVELSSKGPYKNGWTNYNNLTLEKINECDTNDEVTACKNDEDNDTMTSNEGDAKSDYETGTDDSLKDDELSQIAAAYKMCYFTEDKDGNIQYYDKDGNEIEKEDYEENCAGLTEIKCDIISDNISEFLNHLFWVISIAGILLLVIMTMVEFIKALTGSDDSGLIKGFKHTLIRIIAVIILLLLPTILTALLNLVNKYSTYKIGEDGSVTCGIGVNK